MAGEKVQSRVWFLSPAIATAFFFAAQLFLALTPKKMDPGVAAASAKTPTAIPMEVRIVQQIRPVEDRERSSAQTVTVPQTEQDFLKLFGSDSAVVFFHDEVEVVETPAKEFETSEVDVIHGGVRDPAVQVRRAVYRR